MSVLTDYEAWHWLQVKTGDIDPAYPVLRRIGQQLSRDDAAWLVLRHVTYYHLGSALRSHAEAPGPVLPEALLRLPTGTERRAHRDVRQFRRHWDALVEHVGRAGGPRAWLTPNASGTRGWEVLTHRIMDVHGNGRWAAYKLCEIAAKVLDVPIVAPDAGHAYSTGPRKGLALLMTVPPGNSDAVIALLDKRTEQLRRHLNEPDVAQVETSLCDFHSAAKGRYYIGKDIDEQLHHLHQVPSDFTPLAFAARAQSFPPVYLGEVGGWGGVDRDRCRVYRDTGRIVVR
ncbi:hypothetical protein SEA_LITTLEMUNCHKIN_3 [Gordonia phage LittleMunchkin]|nr:hypothetical protein SEA_LITTLEMUNCHKIN_3 [Gordonia phage LittleMunchkin]